MHRVQDRQTDVRGCVRDGATGVETHAALAIDVAVQADHGGRHRVPRRGSSILEAGAADRPADNHQIRCIEQGHVRRARLNETNHIVACGLQQVGVPLVGRFGKAIAGGAGRGLVIGRMEAHPHDVGGTESEGRDLVSAEDLIVDAAIIDEARERAFLRPAFADVDAVGGIARSMTLDLAGSLSISTPSPKYLMVVPSKVTV